MLPPPRQDEGAALRRRITPWVWLLKAGRAPARPVYEPMRQTPVVHPVTRAPHRRQQLRDERGIDGVIHDDKTVLLVVRPLRGAREPTAVLLSSALSNSRH